MPLLDRCAEKQALHEVLDSERAGMSGSLVLRGGPGVGKSVLLGYAVERAADLQALPGFEVAGLPEPDAYELLKMSLSGPIDVAVAQRIIAETGGNRSP